MDDFERIFFFGSKGKILIAYKIVQVSNGYPCKTFTK